MSMKSALSTWAMTTRILEREDNIYKRETIMNIINMFMEETREALLKGERIQITRVGTIIPEVRTHTRQYYLPTCSGAVPDSPYSRIRVHLNDSLRTDMKKTLLRNIKNGIYGLEKLPFDIQQINILKKGGYIPEDAVVTGRHTESETEDTDSTRGEK